VSEIPDGEERPWIAMRVEPSGDSQAVIDTLFAQGSLGVQEDGAVVITHFPPDADVTAIEDAVHAVDAAARVEIFVAPRTDWSEWRASVQAHRLGKITITPPWLASERDTEDASEFQVIIEPAMAFGTGEHATTRGVVRLMQHLESMPSVVADLGSGSAVLSIAAAKLGAERVAAIELDPDATGNAEENVIANGVASRVKIFEGDAAVILPLIAPVGLVLANIISSVLLELLQTIRDSLAPGGHAILSGILLEERSMMLSELSRAGWKIIAEDSEEAWWSVLIAAQQ
jgi:ribosomal protein L11 methyltransferase